ncbi:MAG: aminotransferase class V-fold PLP-dependent enzyme [Anaerolineales bacterium]|nr:aminotransferase class V-fold PLP-dependent enzyme [Anaerolineales bacterium]
MTSSSPALPSSKTRDSAIYLDNAATSWPKPPEVALAMTHFIEEIGANPGRSGHRLSIEAARVMFAAREAIAELFGENDPLRVIFGLNVTDGINLALHGLLKPGDHVITSSMEHNSVMRPLNDLSEQGVDFTQAVCNSEGVLDLSSIETALRSNTRVIVINHASNVCGTIQPIAEIGQLARRHNLIFLVDAAQTAGVIPIDMQHDHIDLLAFTGHKSLYGPMGVGGLIVSERVDPVNMHPSRQGGTGSRSEREVQPDFFPDRFECGTPNAVGVAGLLAAMQWINEQGMNKIRMHEERLCAELLQGLLCIPGVKVYGPQNAEKQTGVVSFNIQGIEASTVGLRLDDEFGILCRVGLHCAPSAHRTLGTFPKGNVRFGIGAFNTIEDIHQALQAVSQLAKEVS